MRYYVFVSLLAVAIALDLAFLGLGMANPQARLFRTRAALAAPRPTQIPTSTPVPPPRPPRATPITTPEPIPTAPRAPSPTLAPSPTATAIPTVEPSPTAPPQPRLLASKSVAFTPSDRAVRANIRLALAQRDGALTRVVLAPGEVFSFNAALGPRPQRLPWKNVRVEPKGADANAEAQLVQGGGLCDLASRYVMAARGMLPARAFRFVNHVRSNGIHLAGVPARDSVSIWAIGGGKGEQDLTIANTSGGWLEWQVARQGEKLTVTARLWDRSPPNS